MPLSKQHGDNLDLANSNPQTVAIVDGSGNQITSFGGGGGSLSVVDAGNSTTTPLPDSTSFNGASIEVLEYKTISVYLATDTDCSIIFNYSNDGTNFDVAEQYNFSGFVGAASFHSEIRGQYFKLAINNFSGSNQTYLRAETTLHPTAIVPIKRDSSFTTSTVPTSVYGLVSIDAVSGGITPGTGAAQLGKEEDSTHSSGSTGVMSLGVRVDTPDTLVDNDGDYAPLQIDASGALRIAGQTNPSTYFNKTITYVPIAQGAPGTTTLVAASVDNKHKLMGVILTLSAAGTIKFTDGAGDLTGAMSLGASGGFVIPTGALPLLETSTTNTALNIVTTGGNASGVAAILTEA